MEKETDDQEISIPGLLTLHKDGRITRVEQPQEEQGIPPSTGSTLCSKDILLQHSLKARLFLPTSTPQSPKLPLILFFHGGGFVSLSPSSPGCHTFCTELAIKARSLIISVDYRLAPEHRLPAAFEDGLSSLLWVKAQSLSTDPLREPWLASHADFTKVFLAGASSGASIAHHVAVQACQQDVLDIAGLVLVVPFLGGQVRTRSELDLAEGSRFTLEGCDKCWALSLPLGAHRDHPFSNVNMAPHKVWADKSIPWPPSVVVIGGKDILHDRQLEYARQLEASSREVTVVDFDNADHFMSGEFHDLMLERITKFILSHHG
eukprot:c21493_g1_i1 orf=93-1049(+)